MLTSGAAMWARLPAHATSPDVASAFGAWYGGPSYVRREDPRRT
jgi:hypothetical protein